MDYITVKEAVEKWGVSERAITYQLTAGRIPGAVKKGNLWLIPISAHKPADLRKRLNKPDKISTERRGGHDAKE